MIELNETTLDFSFPEVHPAASLSISFQRTLRIPDDGTDYPLPAGLGAFPVEHVDDHLRRVPSQWLKHGGVMLPMYQGEAMYIDFSSSFVEGHGVQYPFAVKIAAGKIDAVTGEGWSQELSTTKQNYIVVPDQPWLDGFCVEQGVIRQFVAMPLGAGFSVEEQLTGEAEHGGLQIMVCPMSREAFERHHPERDEPMTGYPGAAPLVYSSSGPAVYFSGMGMGAGGRMRQQVYDDPYDLGDWNKKTSSRCFVHLTDSQSWEKITGRPTPTKAPTAKTYANAGVPWFDHYVEAPVVGGSEILRGVKSVTEIDREKGGETVAKNEPIDVKHVIQLRKDLSDAQVREGEL